MKILLVGSTGQLGFELDRQARERNVEIRSFGHGELDITEFEKVKDEIEKFSPDFVINASAFHVVPLCEDEMEKAFLINAVSLKPIAQYCEERGIRLVTYSTDYIFDGLKGSPYEEDDKPNPLQIYGLSKLAGEYIVLNYSSKSIVIRTCSVHGGKEGSHSKKGNFALNILKQAETQDSIEVASEQIVSPTYSVDLASATLDLLKEKNINGIYHLINEGYCSWAELAQYVIDVKGLKTKIIPVDKRGMAGSLRRPLFSALKNTRAKELGIELPSWKDTFKRYISTL